MCKTTGSSCHWVVWIIHDHTSNGFWQMTVSLSVLDGWGFHYFLIEVGETWLALLTALIERWGPETFTFYLRVREITITLQDVTVLLELPIHGPPVTGTDDRDWAEKCETLLGREPPPTAIRGRLWSIKAKMAPSTVQRGSVDICAGPAACTW